MMKNLVISAACGLEPSQIKFFLKSLRKFYNEEIFFSSWKKRLSDKKIFI